MPPRFEFWFDFSCPYAYLASTQVEALAERTGAELVPCPVLLGGVFRARGTAQNLAGTLSAPKARHNSLDLERHARLFGVPLVFPGGHPMRTVTALRSLLVVGAPFLPLAHRFFEAYWVRGIDLASDSGVAQVLTEAGHDADAVIARCQDPEVKDELRRRTDQGIERGLFGVPGFVVDDRLYWGQDRLGEVEEALGGATEAQPGAAAHPEAVAACDFYFDYSSPFTWLASRRIEGLLGPAVRWRPMLLGAVFKQVGAPNVPLHAMNEAKRAWTGQDLDRQAAAAGVELTWPSGFPLNTVLALRVTLLADPDSAAGRALVHRIFSACWQEDVDPSDPAVIAALCDEVGLSGADLVERAGHPTTKMALREATDAAVEAGVFGAPTVVVDGPAGPSLFWGNDRLDLATRAARGDDRLLIG